MLTGDIMEQEDRWSWIYEILDNLVNAEQWPQKKLEGTKGELHIASSETATMQVETYWRYAVDGISIRDIAKELNIAEKAAWKRVEKIRNWVCVGITGNWTWWHRIRAAQELMTLGNLTRAEALRAMTINAPILLMFKRRAKKEGK